MDKQIQLVDYTDDESESSSTAPAKQRSKCVWGIVWRPGFEQLSLVVQDNEAMTNALQAMFNETPPLDETLADDQQRPKLRAALQAERALSMLSAKKSRNVPLAAANDQPQVMRAPKKPGRAFLSACDESNGMAIGRVSELKIQWHECAVWFEVDANDSLSTETPVVSASFSSSSSSSSSSTYTARQRQNYNKKLRQKMWGQVSVDAPAEKFGPRVRKNPKTGKYEVQAILATTTYKKDWQLRRIFYVGWLGYSEKYYSWVLSEWMDTQELLQSSLLTL
ncbi:hypothetical protein niasHT_001276 [Heterodera trifolii]|uniref:Chromo domain-containing protein n=1 Tax=Heterodera trifolii TaxID=157864 RepID=A0ABD2LNB0_9BILA